MTAPANGSVKKESGSVVNYDGSQRLKHEELFELPIDILVPASVPDVINGGNVDDVKAKIVVEAANIPATRDVEKRLHERGVLVVPDIIANAGGVISSYAEYMGENPRSMFKLVESKIVKNVRHVLENAGKEKKIPRDAALTIAKKRVRAVMGKN